MSSYWANRSSAQKQSDLRAGARESLIKIEVDPDNVLARKFTELEQKNLPFAVMQAVNATAFEIRETWKRTSPRVFDRPTPMTMNSVLYTKATKSNLAATVFIKNEGGRGNAPDKYLRPQVDGGARNEKGLEVLLQAKGVMPAGMFAVPGDGAKLNAYGNMPAGQITAILSSMGALRDSLQNETDTSVKRRTARRSNKRGTLFALKQSRGRLLPGIYERFAFGSKASIVRSILIFVRGVQYKPRYDIFGLAQRTWDKLMPFHFNRELEKAIQTSKFRGKA